jgi:hypothetical protein
MLFISFIFHRERECAHPRPLSHPLSSCLGMYLTNRDEHSPLSFILPPSIVRYQLPLCSLHEPLTTHTPTPLFFQNHTLDPCLHHSSAIIPPSNVCLQLLHFSSLCNDARRPRLVNNLRHRRFWSPFSPNIGQPLFLSFKPLSLRSACLEFEVNSPSLACTSPYPLSFSTRTFCPTYLYSLQFVLSIDLLPSPHITLAILSLCAHGPLIPQHSWSSLREWWPAPAPARLEA